LRFDLHYLHPILWVGFRQGTFVGK